MTLDEFLDLLEEVRPAGNGYVAICPAHEDSSPSLSITESDEGILLNCHAGCSTESVVESLDLEMRDLFFKPRSSGGAGEPEAIYSYQDEVGIELYQALRFPGKNFRQRYMGPDGEWVWNLKERRRVLYRLPEIIAAVADGKTIYLCEGEKDVEALVARGHEATCNPMGAGKWKPEYSEVLVGANVIIIQDKDEPGRAHAERVKQSLLGKANGVWVVQAKTGKDAYDHFENGHAINDFVESKVKNGRGVYSAHDLVVAARESIHLTKDDIPTYTPVVFEGYREQIGYRQGRLYSCGGYTGDGKTAFALQTARGLCEAGVHVGYFSLEMTQLDLLNRLIQHRGVPLFYLENPWLIPGSQYEQAWKEALDEIGSWNLGIIFDPSVVAKRVLEETVNAEYDFIIIDHVHRFAWGSDRRALESELVGLTNIALDYNIPVLILAQLRKFAVGKDMAKYPKPTLQDFSESSVFGNESARAMAVWRARDKDGLTYDPSGVSHLIVLKDRHGSPRDYIMKFDGRRQLFGQREETHVQPVGSHPDWSGTAPASEEPFAVDVWGV